MSQATKNKPTTTTPTNERDPLVLAAAAELARIVRQNGYDAFHENTPDREAVVLWGQLLFATGGVPLMLRVYEQVRESTAKAYRKRPSIGAAIMHDLEHRWDGIGHPGGRIGRDVWHA